MSSLHSSRRTVTRAITLAIAASLALGGCSSDSSSSPTTSGSPTGSADAGPSSGSGGAGGGKTVAFVSAFNAALYFQAMRCGAQAAAKESGIDLSWSGPPQWDVQAQIPMLNAATQSSPAGMIVVPTDPKALIAPIKSAIAKGIVVTTVDGSLDQKVEVQNIRTDNLAAGKLAGQAIVKLTGGEGKVLVVGLQPGVSANQERIDGFVEGVKGAKLNLLPTEYSQGDQGKASQIVSAAIQANPDLKAVYTTLAPASAGAASAINAAGKRGQIKLVAYDADPAQVKQLKDGVVDALVAQEPYKEGYQSVKTIAGLLDGSTAKDKVPYQEHTSAFVITKDNVDSDQAKSHIYSADC